MTREESIKVLAILKAAYPNSYKGMTKEEANGTVMIWATQFVNVPADIVLIAVQKIISTNQFPPSISEIKAKFGSIYWEAKEKLIAHKNGFAKLSDADAQIYTRITDITEDFRAGMVVNEPTINELIGSNKFYLEG